MGMASGGARTNASGDISYHSPVIHSPEFYNGLRWCVMITAWLLAALSLILKKRRAGYFFLAVGALFNPFLILPLSKECWELMDVLAFWALIGAPWTLFQRKSRWQE
jgi:hypothetical protein